MPEPDVVTVETSAPPEQRASLLTVQKVSKSFGGLTAVNNMSLEVTPGTITGLIGPNAAGKTTLFNLIAGLYKSESGAIYFGEERIDGLSPHRIFHKGICRTFQISRELKLMTVLENLMLVPPDQSGENLLNTWLRPWRVRAQERELKEKALEVLRFVNLIHLKDEFAGNLSAFEKWPVLQTAAASLEGSVELAEFAYGIVLSLPEEISA